jgi:protein translocase SecG subunit
MVEILVSLKWPLIIMQAIVAPVLVILVLIQSGKGDDLGSALSGGGGGSSVLGTGGASKFLVRATVIFATVFLLNSVILAKVFKETSLASVGGSQSEPLAPANALQFDTNTATNSVGGSPAKK